MEGVYHIDIIEVGRSSLIGNVHRMLERETPHREGFKLRITGLYATLVLIVKLTETYCHLTAAGTGGGDDDKRTRSLHIVIASETIVRINEIDIGRITLDGVVIISSDAEAFESLAESIGTALAVVVGNHYRPDKESAFLKLLAQTQHIHVIGDAKVIAHLVFSMSSALITITISA